MSVLQTVIIVADSATVDGGLGKVAVTSALALRDRGLEVIFFCPLAAADPRFDAAGVTVVLMGEVPPADDPNRLRGMVRGLWNRSVAQALQDLCGRYDPATTVLHCHGFSKALSPAIGPVLVKGSLPVVYTMHEFFLTCPNGGFFDFPRRAICTRKPLGLSCITTQCDSRAASHKAWRILRQGMLHGPGRLPRGLRDVITISDTQERVMAPYLGNARLHRVSNPVDFADAPRVKAEDNDVFLFVGRLEPDKGALEFAQAAAVAGARAVFVGAGSQADAIRAALPTAELTGWLEPADVSAWMNRARALVFPSLWYECQPLVPMEALRRGLPVITGRWNAAHEVVCDNETGIVLDDIADLAGALGRMTAARAGAFSQAAFAMRDQIGATPAAHAAALATVYDRVIARKASP